MIKVRLDKCYIYFTHNKSEYRSKIINIILEQSPKLLILKCKIKDIFEPVVDELGRYEKSINIFKKPFKRWLKDFDDETYIIITKCNKSTSKELRSYQNKIKKHSYIGRGKTKYMTDEEKRLYWLNYYREYRNNNREKIREYDKKYREKKR